MVAPASDGGCPDNLSNWWRELVQKKRNNMNMPTIIRTR